MMSGEKNWNLKLTEFAKNSQNPMRCKKINFNNPLKLKLIYVEYFMNNMHQKEIL